MNDVKIEHISKSRLYEIISFEKYIISCLKKEFPNKIVENNDMNFRFDCKAIDGLGFFDDKRETYIDIKYSNNLISLMHFITKIHNFDDNIIIIGLWKKESIERFKNLPKNMRILGFEFIEKMTNKYPILWWSFVGGFYENARIELSEDGENAILRADKLGFFGPEVSIKINEIDEISDANKEEFLRLINNESINPALIIGNGVSIPFGSDCWIDLSNNIFNYISPLYIDNPDIVKKMIGNSNYSNTSMAKTLLPSDMYYSAIWSCVYRKYNPKYMHNSNTLIRAICKAKNRHPNLQLLTYNYDCFIENDYESLYKTNLNIVKSGRKMNSIKEPRIIHLHGFLDYKSRIKNKVPSTIVLTDDDYFNAYKGGSFTVRNQIEMLENNICLYVGSSMSDLYQMSLINEVREKVIKRQEKTVWKCFALMCLKGLSPKDKLSIINYYLRKGVYIIFVDDYSKLPSKLDELMNY